MIWADSFLLHRKSKTPPEKGGVFTSLDGLRRFSTLSQLNKYTSEGRRHTFVAAGEACVRLRSSRGIRRTVHQEYRTFRFYDCCAAERRLRQLLQVA
ncbi:hypothetical protein C1Y11_27470 [Pseudomonas sp. FW305-20]|nr:hypothetical protein C1Y11_27470 [Pseudomonas sp. FW305-20]PMU21642.1 hypothetical protein C1Y10_03720 [Pseudomonas sp. FW305-122]PMU37469.1 hypothetical protein C1Y12_19495 [Pseudomonas sp. FW305-47B]PMX65815.1 hypothetical protein C1Y13_01150 [Pseudomonas sp. FW305-33]PMX71581.1 hypothetical protein C1X12_02260 [Pseudomonas sp. FW305-60]